MKSLAAAALAVAAVLPPAAAQPVVKVSHGRVERLANFGSRHVDARHVDVWLPAGYDGSTPHAVLYMHDGQMLFDAGSTWNGKAWAVHQALQPLISQGLVRPTIVVGVWNNGKYRHSEYFPQKFLPFVAEPMRTAFVERALEGRPRADAYLRFLVEELKPEIDRRYATLPGRDGSFLMGSSMGGLISLYAMSEYPQVFGGAACLSTHWVGTFEANAAFPLAAFNYLRERLPKPDGHRLYMDRGTAELDALYGPAQTFVDQIVRDSGYSAANSESRVFEGAGHDEIAWAGRLHIPLQFLLGTR